jgi:hypothetical protein
MKQERRLVGRVLRDWTAIAYSGRFPRRDDMEHWMRGEVGPISGTLKIEKGTLVRIYRDLQNDAENSAKH